MSEFSLDHVNDMYVDVLREIGNIGAGNATTAIAKMLGSLQAPISNFVGVLSAMPRSLVIALNAIAEKQA